MNDLHNNHINDLILNLFIVINTIISYSTVISNCIINQYNSILISFYTTLMNDLPNNHINDLNSYQHYYRIFL